MSDNLPIADIVWDPSIYPRAKWNTHTIEHYADALNAGEKFPPIVLEQGTNRLLDGKQRLEAHKKIGATEIDIEFRTVPDGVPLKLYCASLSVKHGDRITPAERRTLAREIIEANPEFNTVTLAKYLSVSKSTAHGYVKDLLARRREERAVKGWRLTMLGWRQDGVARLLGVTRETVYQDRKKFSETKKSYKQQLAQGHSVAEAARRCNLPLLIANAIACDDLDDAGRLDHLGITLQPYDVWAFPRCHELFANDHPGRVAGELVAHTLYFFSKPNDLIIDPMAGGGTALDVSLMMGRRCFGYDIDDRHERCDIIAHNMAQDGWPKATSRARLIFWDPPYFSKMDKATLTDGYVEGSISALPRDEYLKFFATAFAGAIELTRRGTRLAFLMSDWDDGDGNGIFIWHYADLLRRAGWRLVRHIQSPLPTQQVHADIVLKFRASRRLARLERYLIIAEKP